MVYLRSRKEAISSVLTLKYDQDLVQFTSNPIIMKGFGLYPQKGLPDCENKPFK